MFLRVGVMKLGPGSNFVKKGILALSIGQSLADSLFLIDK